MSLGCKHPKVQLRLDAARRAFTVALADVAGSDGVSVNMVPDAKQGNRAVIRVAPVAGASRQAIEDSIRERMKFYSTPYEIEWATPDRELSSQS